MQVVDMKTCTAFQCIILKGVLEIIYKAYLGEISESFNKIGQNKQSNDLKAKVYKYLRIKKTNRLENEYDKFKAYFKAF